MSYNNILKDSLNINKRNTKMKNHKGFNTALIKRFNNNNTNMNINSKFKKNKNLKKLEERHTYRQSNSKLNFFDKGQNNNINNNMIKREKSAEQFKKKHSLRQKVYLFFNEFRYFDTNYFYRMNKKGKQNNKFINNKNYNTLILFKKNKGDTLVEKKRKSYFSPGKNDPNNKDNFYKKLLNLRTVSSSKYNSNRNNNDILLFNHKENMNINNNNYESNYGSLFKSINNIHINKPKNKSNTKKNNKNKNKNHNKKSKILHKQNPKKNINILYKSQK